MFSGIWGQSRSLKRKCVTFHARGVPRNKKNVYEEAKVMVKTEAAFLIVFKPDYRDVI